MGNDRGKDWPTARQELQLQIARIRRDGEHYGEMRPPEAPGLEREQQHARISTPAERMPFGRWLLTQRDREGWIGDLARSAVLDRAFPAMGNPEAVRARLRALGADGDVFEALEDAELDWLSY